MDSGRVEAIFAECERSLASGGRIDLRALHFWQAVEAVKRRPEWVDRYAERIGAIDREAFRRAVLLILPLPFGVSAVVLGTIAGLVLIAAAFLLPSDLGAIALLLGTGAVLGTTHGLTHYLVGRAVGIRFTHWFSKLPRQPQPGFKIDYASYLRTPPRARAWMHASGAIVSKVVPFAALPLAFFAGVPWWAPAILAALGVVQLFTDALLSVRLSDWKRFRREMRVARETAAR